MLGLEGKGGSISRASESLAAAVVLAKRKEEMKAEDDIAGKDELILEPNIDVIRRRHTYLVTDFNKQIGRKEEGYNDPTKDEYFIAVGNEEEKLADPSAKRPIVYDFGKPKQRDDKQTGILAAIAEIL